MENASKSLLIAGSILVCILIIAAGMYIYNTSGSSIQTSVTTMSTSEIEAYNNKYIAYEGEQTGSNIKSLVGVLASNVSLNEDENSKIPGLYLEKDKKMMDSGIPENGETSNYLDILQDIKRNIESKHRYWVEVSYQKNGLIDYINISYDKNHTVEPKSRN